MLNNNKFTNFIIFNLTLLLLSGCAINRATVDRHPSANLESIKSLHVQKFEPDGRGIDLIIANRLKQMGYRITTGHDVSSDVDAVVTYKDKWMWDFTMYMIELTVTVRDKESNFPLATGNSLHTSLTRKSPKEMVYEVLANLFSKTDNE